MLKKAFVLAAILLQLAVVSVTPAAADCPPEPPCFPCAL